MALFNIPKELLYEEDQAQGPNRLLINPLLNLGGSGGGGGGDGGLPVASPTGEPTPYTTMENSNNFSPTSYLRSIASEDPEVKRLRQAQIDSIRKGIDAQKEGLKGYEDLGKRLNGSGQLDLSPLLALTDAWTGSNFQKGYQRPETPEELAYKKAQVNQMIQKARGDITASEIGLLKNLDDRNYQKEAIRLAQLEGTQKRADRGYGFKQTTGFRNDYKNDDVLKKSREGIRSIGEVESILTSGSKIGEQGVRIKLARAMGAAPISDTDIAMLSGDPSIQARLQRVAQKMSEGTMTEEDRQDALLLSREMKKLFNAQAAQRQKYYEEDVGPNAYGLDPMQAKRIIGQDLAEVKVPGASVQAAPVKPSVPNLGNGPTTERQKRIQQLKKELGRE